MHSEEYIRANIDKINWFSISSNQKLSEYFIREFKDKVKWNNISRFQKLSEDFIREFQDEVHWYSISKYHTLTEDFIREFKDKVYWHVISIYQKLSENFIKEFKDKIDMNLQLKTHHNELSLEEKEEIVKKYCEKYCEKCELEYDKEYLYAFRDHDLRGSGLFNKIIKYKKNKYYRDWRCNLDPDEINSFGYGIFPKGNTKVKVKIEDIGCWINNSNKLRVWGFEMI